MLIFLIAASMVGIAHARKFQSADGSKEIEADFVRYNPRTGDVTLRMTNGRNMITKSTFFSDDDREYFKEEYRKQALKGAISVRQYDKLDHYQREKDNLWIDMTKSEWSFTVKNESKVDLKHLDVKYWVVVERDNFGDETNETSSGEAAIVEGGRGSQIHIATIPGLLVEQSRGGVGLGLVGRVVVRRREVRRISSF